MMQEERILRVRDMEDRLNRILAWLSAPDPRTDPAEDVRALDRYYRSELWRLDFEADEAGLLPPDLPRGVLSEDGIYNALADYAAHLPAEEST